MTLASSFNIQPMAADLAPLGGFQMHDGEFLSAHFRPSGDFLVATIGLTVDAPVDEVWRALTASDRLCQWLAPGSIEPREGGRAQLDFGDSGVAVDSVVIAVEPRRLLEYSWSGAEGPLRPVRWLLEAIGDQTQVGLSLTMPVAEDVARAAAGWAAHLEMLAAVAAGATMKFPFETFQAARAAYGEQLATLAPRPAAA